MSLPMTTLSGNQVELDDDVVAAFSARLEGRAIQPGDAGYDDARAIWNAMIDKRPGLIVECASASDTVACVNFAREHDLLISIRGAGHNIAGSSLSDGGLLIDHKQLRRVTVNGDGTATVEPGATLGDVDQATQAHGCAVPVGINSTTGIAGLTLGGGFGWISRKFGLTVDALVSAEVVTADGQLRPASADENPDLFWALRGGGGNFGAVTSFTYRTCDLGPEVYAGFIVYDQADAPAILRKYRDFVSQAPDELTAWAVLRQAPPLPFLPEDKHGTDVLVMPFCWSGSVQTGEAATAGLQTFGTPIGMHVGPMPFVELQTAFDPLLVEGARNYWKSHNFAALTDRTLDTVLRYAGNLPTGETEIFLANLGGAVNRIAPDATAYSHRDTAFVLNVHCRWQDPDDDERCVAWSREFFDASAADATGGVYVNFMPDDEADRTGSAFGPNMDRLAEIKQKYDPENRFRRNQNIQPITV